MSGLAKYLLEQGCEVSGSDVCESKYTDKLESLGARAFIGHSAGNVPASPFNGREEATVVASTAIREDNPEILRAKELGLPILHRSDLLSVIASEQGERGNLFIGYAGTHGKTTTSGLAAYVLEKAGLEPSYIVGGFVPELNTNAHCARGKYFVAPAAGARGVDLRQQGEQASTIFVAELDESDGTLVKYKPDIAVINNLEPDHLDFFTDGMDGIFATFGEFAAGAGKIVANNDDENVCKLLEGRDYVSFGLNDADYVARNINYGKDFTTFEVNGTQIKIILQGEHNVYNTLAVFASLVEAGVEPGKIAPYFATFSGMGRRFEKVAEVNGITVIDDYAHHPTEIKATLEAAKHYKNVVAVFQPHRYTRLKELWDEFLSAFEGAQRVVVTDIYAASEAPIEGISAEAFAEQLKAEHISGDMREFARKLLPTLNAGDTVIGMGAGTITYLGKELLDVISQPYNI